MKKILLLISNNREYYLNFREGGFTARNSTHLEYYSILTLLDGKRDYEISLSNDLKNLQHLDIIKELELAQEKAKKLMILL